MGMIQFPTDELRLRRLVSQAYANRRAFRGDSPAAKVLMQEDGCTARDLRGLMLEEAIGRCCDAAVSRQIVRARGWAGDPTRVYPEDAMAMLVHAALTELLGHVTPKRAADALTLIARAIRRGEQDLREVVLATLDEAVHGQRPT